VEDLEELVYRTSPGNPSRAVDVQLSWPDHLTNATTGSAALVVIPTLRRTRLGGQAFSEAVRQVQGKVGVNWEKIARWEGDELADLYEEIGLEPPGVEENEEGGRDTEGEEKGRPGSSPGKEGRSAWENLEFFGNQGDESRKERVEQAAARLEAISKDPKARLGALSTLKTIMLKEREDVSVEYLIPITSGRFQPSHFEGFKGKLLVVDLTLAQLEDFVENNAKDKPTFTNPSVEQSLQRITEDLWMGKGELCRRCDRAMASPGLGFIIYRFRRCIHGRGRQGPKETRDPEVLTHEQMQQAATRRTQEILRDLQDPKLAGARSISATIGSRDGVWDISKVRAVQIGSGPVLQMHGSVPQRVEKDYGTFLIQCGTAVVEAIWDFSADSSLLSRTTLRKLIQAGCEVRVLKHDMEIVFYMVDDTQVRDRGDEVELTCTPVGDDGWPIHGSEFKVNVLVLSNAINTCPGLLFGRNATNFNKVALKHDDTPYLEGPKIKEKIPLLVQRLSRVWADLTGGPLDWTRVGNQDTVWKLMKGEDLASLSKSTPPRTTD
jgi:hypothetical protein